MITIVLNFVCNYQSRLDVLNAIFPKWVEVLDNYKFIINYDTNVNLQAIRTLYENNIKDCQFTNDVGRSWVKKTIEMVESANTPYIYYLFEDVAFSDMVTKEYFNKMLNEFHENNAKHLMLGKTGKYSNLNWWKNTPCEKHSIIRTFNSNVPYDCCFPLAGVWDKELFLNVLQDVNLKIPNASPIKQIDGVENISNLYRNKNIKQACPLQEITHHIQHIREAKR